MMVLMSRTYKKQRTKPKTTKVFQKQKHKLAHTYDAYTDIFQDRFNTDHVIDYPSGHHKM